MSVLNCFLKIFSAINVYFFLEVIFLGSYIALQFKKQKFMPSTVKFIIYAAVGAVVALAVWELFLKDMIAKSNA